jgi:endonuclease I
MRKFLFFISLMLLVRTLIAQIPVGYYNGTEGLEGSELKSALYNIIKGHTEFPYTISGTSSTDTWDILKLSDQDTVNPENIILIYSGASVNAAQEWNSGNGWSREHVWSKSHGFPPDSGDDPAPGAGTDAHHLRPEDPSVNSAKGNKDFDMGGTPVASAPECNSTSNTWEPRDEVKGDVARMIFYMATRYLGENGEPNLQIVDYTPSIDPPGTGQQPFYGKLSTLIIWNLQDPPNNFERHRNEVIFLFQDNRNPFIDFPEWANCIWNNCVQVTFISKPDTTVNNGELYSYNVQFAGLSGKILEITAENLPVWLELVQTSNTTALLSGTPTEENIGEYPLILNLSDGTSSANQEFNLTVSESGAGTVIVGQDFTSCTPTSWTTFSVTGTKNWTCTGGYSEMNGYSSDVACNDWLISPQMNLNEFIAESLTFTSWSKYTDINYPQLTLKYSSDYVVGQNPENYFWTDLPCTLSPFNSQIWTSSGIIDLSDKNDESSFVAFKYVSSGTGSGTCAWWKVDDILLTGTPHITDIFNKESKKVDLEIFPNPLINTINLSYYVSENSLVQIEIFNLSGQQMISLNQGPQNSGNHTLEVDLTDLPLGVYLIKMNIGGTILNKKVVKI